MIQRILEGVLVISLISNIILWNLWKNEQNKARLYSVCEEVNDIRNGVNNETDDGLIDRITDPNRLR